MVEEVYRWLPLGTVIDGKVIVVHGGVSETTDLKQIHCLAREKVNKIIKIFHSRQVL
jgi:serine/threonine-protein phosphatase with EF-hand domain